MKAKIEPLSILIGFITAILIFLLVASAAKTPTYGRYQVVCGSDGAGAYVLDTQTSELWYRMAAGAVIRYLGTNTEPTCRYKELHVEQINQ